MPPLFTHVFIRQKMQMTHRAVAIIGNQAFSLLNFRGALIEDLVARGHKVYALAPEIDQETASALMNLGAEPVSIALSRTGTNPLADVLSIFQLRKVLRGISPSITLSYAAKPAIYGSLAAWLAGVPARFAMIEGLGYVFGAGSELSFRQNILRRLVVGLFRVSLSKTQKVFFLNNEDVADFTALGVIQYEQAVNVGGIGVDLARWLPSTIVSSPVTFIFIARLLKEKGIVDFVEAARLVKGEEPSVRFVVVGGVDENPNSVTSRDVETWVSEGLIEWPGHVEVSAWLNQASVFVLPSYYREGVPRSTQEAMAMGRPVITTDSVGCRDTVENGRNGYLVPVRDPIALAAAMKRFIDTPELIVTMGKASREMAEARFDVRKVNAKIIENMGL